MAAPVPIKRARSFRVAPIARSERTSRSIDTERSADSILANLDWLVPSCFANCACVNLRRFRRRFRLAAGQASSQPVPPLDSIARENRTPDPTRHPADSRCRRFVLFMARSNQRIWSYCFNRRLQFLMISGGVLRVFLLKTSAITIASGSIRSIIRQVWL